MLEKAAAAFKRRLPALDKRPVIGLDQRIWLDMYYYLDKSRVPGHHIPLGEIESYCRLFGVEKTELFALFIRQLDVAVVDMVQEEKNE